MGKVLVLCAGEQERWNSPAPKQLIEVDNKELLLARTVRQIRKRMNCYPHIVSHQKCLRSFSSNYIVPSAHRWISETLLSVSLIWGSDWTMVLLGDVYYTDGLIDTMYTNREKYNYHFYGTGSEIYALTYTNNELLKTSLLEVVKSASINTSRGKLWELYYSLSSLPLKDAGNGRIGGYKNGIDSAHYTSITDGTRDFDTLEAYQIWRKIKIKGV